MEIILIAGVAKNRVIGKQGKLPWHISSDLKRFKEMTLNSAVIMGHGTYDSIVSILGKPLPNRMNIVLSRKQLAIDATIVNSIEKGIEEAEKKAYDKLFIIGGQTVFEQFIQKDLIDRLELTLIDQNYDGDAYFPELDFSKWRITSKQDLFESGVGISFVSYQRKEPRIKNLVEPSKLVETQTLTDLKEQKTETKKGLFIAFEGIDGCGKSTQIKKITEFIFSSNKHNHVILTREPYQDINIRKVIKSDTNPESNASLLADMFIKDRTEHVRDIISPNLDKGFIVISDRYKLSTIAYQSAQGLAIEDLIERHKNLPKPDLTFIIDVSSKVSGERMDLDSRDKHRFEADNIFLEKVRNQFKKIKGLLKDEKIFIINGEQDKNKIFEDIKIILNDFLIKNPNSSSLESFDPLLMKFIKEEENRQESTINLIPSENYASRNVINACANVLINKYAEGYPFKRYYQGNKNIDEVEALAVSRAKELFNAEHVNVQPYSGSPANLAVYLAFLKPGDTVLGLDLTCGGHLTHGSPVNITGLTYRAVHYGVDENGYINMDKVRQIALAEKPKLIVSGLTAYSRQIDFKRFQEIAEEVGAIHLADISHIAGLIAAGVHPSPFPFTDIVMTTTHKTLRGPRGAILMCKEKFAKQIDKAVFPGCQGGPHENIIASKAVAFKEALSPEFKEYGLQVVKNAKVLADTLMKNSIKLVSNGTDNHLMMIDLRNIGIGLGKEMAVALEEAGLVCNCNTVPYDPSTPMKPSGLRIGTPMITTRGMKENEMIIIGNWISQIIKNPQDKYLKDRIKAEVQELCKKFPIYAR